MKRIIYPALKSIFLTQQRLADELAIPPPQGWLAEPGMRLRRLELAAARLGFQAMRKVIRPELRSQFRIWLANVASSNRKEGVPRQSARDSAIRMKPEGINVIGFLRGVLGLGEAARATLRATAAAGISVSGIDYRRGCTVRQEEEVDRSLLGEQKHFVNLFHMNPDQLFVACHALGPEFFDGHYNILFCFWEQLEFPEEWVHALDHVDEIWTGSRFCQDIIARTTHKPVIRIPLNVDPVVPDHVGRKDLGLPETGFIFLAMADFLSAPERKNPLGVLEAYLRSHCHARENVYLVLKTTNSTVRQDVFAKLKDYQEKFPSLIVLDGHLSRSDVNALVNCCDCLVSLHRAEGFGLPIAEAMALGKPVIATSWSGNMDFMNVGNSFPVRYRIVSLEQDTGSYKKGFHWADPDIDHAAQLMDTVVGKPDLARRVADAGMREIRSNFSPAAAGLLIADRLRRITENFHCSSCA